MCRWSNGVVSAYEGAAPAFTGGQDYERSKIRKSKNSYRKTPEAQG